MNKLATTKARSPQHRAALVLLTECPTFRYQSADWLDSYLIDGGIDFAALLNRKWSSTEGLLIQVAASVYGSKPNGEVIRIHLLDLRLLDEGNLAAVIKAIETVC